MNSLALVANFPPDAPVPKFPIARKPAHEELEQRLAALRHQRKARHQKLDAMVEASRSPGTTPEMRALADELQTIEAEVKRVRTDLIPHRNRHLKDTRTAFREPRRDAARRALALIADLARTVDELNVMSGELRRLGGVHPDLPADKILLYLTLPLERLAREKGGAS